MTPPTKKRKTSHIEKIEHLEQTLTSALAKSASLNSLADFTDLASSLSESPDLHKAIYALYRVFILIIDSGRFCGHNEEGEQAKLVRSWLNERLAEYTTVLCKCLSNDQKGIRTSALEILLSILKHLSEAFSKFTLQPQLHVSCLRKIVNGLLLVDNIDGKLDPDVRDRFVTTWFSVHDDMRWFFLREFAIILRSSKPQTNAHLPENLLSILERLTTMPTDVSELNEFWIPSFARAPPKAFLPPQEETEDAEAEDDWRTFFDTPDAPDTSADQFVKGQSQRVYRLSTHQSLHSLSSHRAQFTACWMALLPHLSASAGLSTRALKFLHRGVMPHLNKPVRLMDWIGGCVDFGGSVGLLALNALFTLMQHYNLDYPNFYTRLYAFLTRDVLHLKHRARFFRLTELFLSSSHLPATLLASFIKRLSRLSLSAPPAAIIMIIPFTYNVLKRHPACMVMIHRDAPDFELDPFDAKEPSPYITNALSSSLWELLSHRNHYHAPVATLARIFSDAFTKPNYAMEDFLDHTYGTVRTQLTV
ncbi:ribosome biogenesis protein Noc4 [Ramaria rubella]|nr:ribosome biogenesis protein Noc4 [Ramaria rubella]